MQHAGKYSIRWTYIVLDDTTCKAKCWTCWYAIPWQDSTRTAAVSVFFYYKSSVCVPGFVPLVTLPWEISVVIICAIIENLLNNLFLSQIVTAWPLYILPSLYAHHVCIPDRPHSLVVRGSARIRSAGQTWVRSPTASQQRYNKRPRGLDALLGHLLVKRIPVTFQLSSTKIPEYLSQK